MKKIYCIIFLCTWICNLSATDIHLKEVKDSLFSFIKRTEIISDYFMVEDLSNDLIRDMRLNEEIREGMNGVFIFSTLSAHTNIHFILIDDESIQIINMRDPFDKNIELLIEYLKRNNTYTKSDILFYISDFIRIYKYNIQINSR